MIVKPSKLNKSRRPLTRLGRHKFCSNYDSRSLFDDNGGRDRSLTKLRVKLSFDSASCFIEILVNSYLRPGVRPSTIEWKTTRQENSSAPSFKHSVKLKFFTSFRLFICEKWKLICILREWCLLYDVNGPGKSRDRRPYPSCFLLINTSNYVM